MTENLQDLRGTEKCQNSFSVSEKDSLQFHQRMEKLPEVETEHFQRKKESRTTEEILKDGKEAAFVTRRPFCTELLP